MEPIDLPTFRESRLQHDAGDSHADAPRGEADRILNYLRHRGATIRVIADIPDALAAIPDEEELSAHACVEGIAITHASDGWWLLLRHDEPLPDESDSPSLGTEIDRC